MRFTGYVDILLEDQKDAAKILSIKPRTGSSFKAESIDDSLLKFIYHKGAITEIYKTIYIWN